MIVGEKQVLVFLLLTIGLAVAYVVWNRTRYATSVSLMIVMSAMFAYSFCLFNDDEPHRWSRLPPPWFVSRIVFAGIGLIVAIGLWRVRQGIVLAGGHIMGLAAVAALIVPATLFSRVVGFAPNVVVPEHSVVVFSIILTVMLGLPLLLFIIETRLPLTQAGTTSSIAVIVVLCIIVNVLGFFEVALDIGPVRNMFVPGVIETRASSTFLNPNFFAVCLVPFVFLAIHLAMCGERTIAYLLIVFSTIGLTVSGSRSVVSILAISIFLLFAVGRARGREIGFSILRAFGVLIGGSIIGFVVAISTAAALGQMAIDRYLTMVIRLAEWPILVFTQTAAFQSIWGRFDLGTLYREKQPVGEGIVDNAYLFLYGTNPFVLLLLTIFFAWLGYVTLARWREQRNGASCLCLSIYSFIILIGLAGQVYWAFSAWLALSVMLAWVLYEVPK